VHQWNEVGGVTRSPVLSVVMAAYNAEPFIGMAIESVLGQTLTDLELIIIEDGSTDGTWETIQEWASRDDRVRAMRNKSNLGTARSLNRGVDAALADLVGRLDADDIAVPHRFAQQVGVMSEHPDIVVIGSNALHIDGNGDVLGLSIAGPTSAADFQSLRDRGEITMVLDGTSVMRREVFESVGGYDPGLPAAWEVDLHCRMAAYGTVLSIEEPLLLYRLHPDSDVATRFFEGRTVHRFVEAREQAILRGDRPPTYGTHLTDEKSAPLMQRARIHLDDLGQFHYRAAGVHLSEGRKGAAVLSMARAFAVSPRFVTKRAWHRRFSPAARARMVQASEDS